jgi:hypothetical protein
MLYGGMKYNEIDSLKSVIVEIFYDLKFFKLSQLIIHEMKGGKL